MFDKEACEQLVAILRAGQVDETSIAEIVSVVRVGKLNEAVDALVKGTILWRAYAEAGKKLLEIYMMEMEKEKEKEDTSKNDPKDELFITKPNHDFNKMGPSKIKVKEGVVLLTTLLGETKTATKTTKAKSTTTTTRKPRSSNTAPIKKGTAATTNKPPILDQPSTSHATFDNSLLAKNKIKDESDSEDKEEKLNDEDSLDFTRKSELYKEHAAFYNDDDSRYNQEDDSEEQEDDSFVPGNTTKLMKNITKIDQSDDVADAPFINPFNIGKRTNNNQNK